MKKIYTILCMALVAMAANAALQLPSMSNVQVRPEMMTKMQTLHNTNLAKINMGETPDADYTRYWTDATGRTWLVFMANLGYAVDFFSWGKDDDGNPNKPDPAMLPMYAVQYELVSWDTATKKLDTDVIMAMFWPTKALVQDPVGLIENVVNPLFEDQPVDTSNVDLSIVQPDELINGSGASIFAMDDTPFTTNLGALFPYMTEDGTITGYAIMNMGADPSYASKYAGIEYYVLSDATRQTTVDFKKFENKDDFVSVENNVYLSPFTAGALNKISDTYEGPATFKGFVKKNHTVEIGQLHVFNTGLVDSNSDEYAELYSVEWGPLRRFELAIPGEDLEVGLRTDKPIPYQQDAWVFYVADEENESPKADYALCALYFPADVTDFPVESQWEMQAIKIDTDYLGEFAANVPTPYKLLNCSMSNLCGWAADDGLYYVYDDDLAQTIAPCAMKFGTDKGFEMFVTDIFGDTYFSTTDKDIVVHYDENNIQLTKTISAIGELPSAVASVSVDNNAPIEFYNLQGLRVAQPENGIFIKRQGSKVSKVLIRK